MADFEIAYRATMNVEAGYSNNASDRGGETWGGISRNNHPNWPGWKRIDELKRSTGFPAILNEDATLLQLRKTFYMQEVWNALNLKLVNSQPIANELFDSGVNFGIGLPAMWLQRVLNVANLKGKYYPDLKIDGQLGAVTITALNRHPNPLTILKALNCLQGNRYIEICEHNPSQEIFFTGWMTRVSEYKAA